MPKIFDEKDQINIRNNLFEVGFKQLRNYGYKAVRVDEITSAVGIAKGTFYNFFISKEEFIIQLMVWQYDKYFKLIEEAMNKPALSDQERIHDLIMHIAQNKHHQLFFLGTIEQSEIKTNLSNESWNIFDQHQHEFFRRFVELIKKDCSICKPGVVGNLFMSLLANIHSPECIPFSFRDALPDTIFYQAQMLIHYINTH